MKSSTHTRGRINGGNRRIQEKYPHKMVVVCAITGLLVCIVVLYFVFRGESDTLSGSPSKGTHNVENTIETIPSAVNQDFRAAASKVRLQLESVENRDIVRVIVEKATGAENKDVVYRYEWSVNGQNAGDGSNALSGFRRGDRISVKVTPFLEEKPGEPRTLSMDVKNSTPKVSASKESTFDGKAYKAQISASDPDGDALSYELVNGPPGMVLDKKNGALSWPAAENDTGDKPVKVRITDGNGGETTYEFTVNVSKNPPSK